MAGPAAAQHPLTARARGKPGVVGALLGALLLGTAPGLRAQAIPRPDYVTYLPRQPLRPVGQTDASVRFHLFGDEHDPGYRDDAPRNGIDDRRDALLGELARTFAPWMVRNTYGFPMDIGRLVREHDVPLVVDRFDLSRQQPAMLASDTLRLGGPAAADDARLEALLRRLGPQAEQRLGDVGPLSEAQEVLYLDMPGEDPKSWAAEYGSHGGAGVSPRYLGYAKAYVHPFLAELPDGAGFELVLQYWFYYPTNDAGNVHEGDFEHVNVIVAPRASVAEPLDLATVAALLDGTRAADDLVVARIEYYFHGWVFPVDFARPNVYLPRDAWQRAVDSLVPQHEGERTLWSQIRRRAYLDEGETRVNTHPLVMIGGDGRGLNLLLRPPGSLGRSSHGSFPFNGLYKKVGPAGTGESIEHGADLHRRPPAVDAPESQQIVRLDHPDRLELLPDWERLAPLALEEAATRRQWAWFLLPVYVGYPATVSPLAGVVRYANTGNVPPGPPPYNGGWNRVGDAAGYAPYLPHRVDGMFAADVQDAYSARWGYLNATIPTLSFLPPFDLLIRLVARPVARLAGRDVPTFARSEDLPPRRVGVGGGVTWFTPSSDFAFLAGFPEIATPLIIRATQVTGTPLQGYGLGPATFDPLVAWRAEISLHLGRHFATTNGLAHGNSTMHQQIVFNDYPPEPITATLDFWEYTGTLRWNLATRRWQPFLSGGYGLSWYRLVDYTAFGEDLGDTRWVRKPGFFENLLPNTWHIGAGLEVLPRYGFGRVNLGLKATANLHLHSLGLSTGNATTVFFQNTTVERWMLALVGTISH